MKILTRSQEEKKKEVVERTTRAEKKAGSSGRQADKTDMDKRKKKKTKTHWFGHLSLCDFIGVEIESVIQETCNDRI